MKQIQVVLIRELSGRVRSCPVRQDEKINDELRRSGRSCLSDGAEAHEEVRFFSPVHHSVQPFPHLLRDLQCLHRHHRQKLCTGRYPFYYDRCTYICRSGRSVLYENVGLGIGTYNRKFR